jgi:hypothetical protein
MVLELPKGHHAVAIDYTRTPDDRWGIMLSVVGLCLSVGLWFLRTRRVPASH